MAERKKIFHDLTEPELEDESLEDRLKRLTKSMFDATNDRAYECPIFSLMTPKFVHIMDDRVLAATREETVAMYAERIENNPGYHLQVLESFVGINDDARTAVVWVLVGVDGLAKAQWQGVKRETVSQFHWRYSKTSKTWVCWKHVGLWGVAPVFGGA